jgi:hypothetical protein
LLVAIKISNCNVTECKYKFPEVIRRISRTIKRRKM